MQDFREVLDECGLADLGFMGNKITWSRHYPDGHIVWERLDRAIGTSAWLSMFPASKVIHLECGSPDHKSIIIQPKGIPIRKPKPWRFEQVWLGKIGCHEAVLAAWQSSYTGSHMEGVVEKVSRCQNKLQSWSKLCFGNITKTLNEKRAALKRAETEALKGDGYESVYTLKKAHRITVQGRKTLAAMIHSPLDHIRR